MTIYELNFIATICLIILSCIASLAFKYCCYLAVLCISMGIIMYPHIKKSSPAVLVITNMVKVISSVRRHIQSLYQSEYIISG